MASKNNVVFSVNELIAISTSLESQIEEVEDLLHDSSFSLDEKKEFMQMLKFSRSASSKVESILSENHVPPQI
jgi:hypothetical protein